MEKNRIIRNLFSNWTGLLVSIVVSFFLAPFVVHNLGNELYGVWTIINQFTGYMYLFDFGVRESVIRSTSHSLAKKDPKALEEVLSASFIIYFFISVITILISIVLALYFSSIFGVEEKVAEAASITVLLVGVTIAQFFIFNIFSGVLMGLQRYDIFNVVNILTTLLKAAAFVLLLSNGYNIVAMAASQMVLGFLGGLYLMHAAKKIAADHGVRFKVRLKIDAAFRKVARKIVNYSTFVLINNLGQKIVFMTDAIVIGIFMPVASVTFYAIAGTLVEYLRQLVVVTARVLMPMVARYSALEDHERIDKTVIDGSKLTLFISYPVVLVFILLGGEFIALWMGEQFRELSGLVLLILAVTQIFSAPHQTLSSVLYGLDKHKMLAFFRIGEAITNLGLSIVLLHYYGVAGVALGTAIPHIILTAVILPIYTTRVIGMNLTKYYLSSYLRPTLAAVPFLLMVLYISHYVTIGSMTQFFGLVIGASMVYLIISFWIIFNASERQQIYQKVKPLLANRSN
ncbi:MAG: MATE family efflux transporter [Candidatus Thiodiazotropha taylori]